MIRLDLQLPEDYEGERLDKLLPLLVGDYSRTFFQNLIKDGAVEVSGKVITKPSFEPGEDDTIAVNLPELKETEILPENIPLDILYEDDDLLVVNKPKGMVVHPAHGHESGTLVNALLYHCKGSLSGINGVMRPGIVHRIDKDTSGSLIVCKNDFAHNAIAEQLRVHSAERLYRAICWGHFPEREGTVTGHIGRDSIDRKKMAVVSPGTTGARHAVTHYEVVKEYKDFSQVVCRLETGRTHQIRVHMTHIGHPLLGDEIYGTRKSPYHLQGQCLHAEVIGFVHPRTGEFLRFTAPLPDYFSHLLEILPR
ncbi:MAG: RluA family pseudouridine synthase [Lachnospiraceae bacterium]|nr:RluA family pseudouridine synthase [Lachnospiraceae bacterium]